MSNINIVKKLKFKRRSDIIKNLDKDVIYTTNDDPSLLKFGQVNDYYKKQVKIGNKWVYLSEINDMVLNDGS